jgi:hypothetical protein
MRKKSTQFKLRHLTVLIVLFLYPLISNAQQYTLTDDDVVVENGVIISCSYNFTNKNIIIPETLDGQTVTVVGLGNNSDNEMFRGRGIKSIQLPATVKEIGYFAFKNNEITNVVIPKSVVRIGFGAFADNAGLSELTLPSVESGDLKFTNWVDTEGNLYDGGDKASDFEIEYYAVVSYTLTDDDVVVENGEIVSCSYNFAAKSIIIPDNLDGQDITAIKDAEKIEDGVFYNKGIISVKLPSTLKRTGEFSFHNNKLPYLMIPDNVEIIDMYSFRSCEIAKLILSNVKDIRYGAFTRNHIQDLNIPGSVKQIEDASFLSNRIVSVAFSEGLEKIGHSAFRSNSLKSVTIPSSVREIEGSAFEVNNIKTVVFGNGITSISSSVFAQNEIDEIVIPNGIESIGSRAFYKNSITKLVLPSGIKTIAKEAFKENKLVNVDLPKGLYSVGDYAFRDNNITDVTIPDNMIYIGKEAFYNPAGVQNPITLPKVEYDNHTFISWIDNSGKEYNINDKVTDYTLSYRAQLGYTLTDDDVVIEDGIIKSTNYSFIGNHITIPEKLNNQEVNSIDGGYNRGVFDNKGLLKVNLPSTLKQIKQRSFENNYLKQIDIPDGVTEIGLSAFENNRLEEVTLPTSVLSIGKYAFYRMSSTLQYIKLPKSVKEGGDFMHWIDDNNETYVADIAITKFELGYNAVFDMYDYNITGKVSGTDGVTVEISGDVSESKTVDNEGDFSFTVEHGQSVKITATKNGYGFVTSEYTFNNVKENKTDLLFKVDDKLTAVNKTNSNDYLKVYPNPVIDKFTVMLNSADRLENIHICDVNGKSLLVKRVVDNSEFIIDISDYRQGVYLLKATLKNGKTSVVKIMKK